jgi:hypothetical protein
MKTYSRGEIKNSHGVYIADFSREKGATELDKFRNFNPLLSKEYNINNKICIVSLEETDDGYYLVCFNSLGECILNTICYGNSKEDIKEYL